MTISPIEIWKIAIDVMLMGSLMFFCLRMLRSPQNPKTMKQVGELELTLRSLIREAENSGKSLNDQLLKRQDALEKVLYELESVEQRINRAVVGVDDNRTNLESLLGRATRANQLLNDSLQHATLISSRRPAEPLSEQFQPIDVPAPPTFEGVVRVAPEPVLPAVEIPRPKPTVASESISLKRPLAASIEREVERTPDKAASSNSGASDISRVYEAAEAMLRAGRDFESVARNTRLPIDQVRLLSQIVIQEQATEGDMPSAVADPRLGVLGGIKRQVQTV